MDHDAPFQRSTSVPVPGTLTKKPTAVHAPGEEHDTAFSRPCLIVLGLGVGWILQAAAARAAGTGAAFAAGAAAVSAAVTRVSAAASAGARICALLIRPLPSSPGPPQIRAGDNVTQPATTRHTTNEGDKSLISGSL